MEGIAADLITTETKTIYLQPNQELFRKLCQEEQEITEKLRQLKLNQSKLHQKRKRSWPYAHPGISAYNTRETIDRKLKEIQDLKQSILDLYVSKRPHCRKATHNCVDITVCPMTKMIKLHKGTHHGSMNSVKERRLFKQIKEVVRGEIETINANARANFRYTYWGKVLDSREAIENHIKVISCEVEELRKKQMRYRTYDEGLDREHEAMEKESRILTRKLENIRLKKIEVSKPQLKSQQRQIRKLNQSIAAAFSDQPRPQAFVFRHIRW